MNEPQGDPITNMHRTQRDRSPDLTGAHGFVYSIETLGKGVAAVLIGGVILSALLSGMALMRTEAVSERAALAERQSALAREDIRIMQKALDARGIETDEHAPERK